jgi:predicted HTH domain antitoxin
MDRRLEKRKQTALDAYGEGLISLGKLAEFLGLDPVSARLYLKDLGIPLQVLDRSGAAASICSRKRKNRAAINISKGKPSLV